MGRKTNSRIRRDPYDFSVDLHGMYSQEAMELVESMIRRHPRSSILIIHGDGTGVLRNAVRGALKAHRFPSVRDYFFGEDIGAPGLDGATVVHT
ncbi:MAG: Smr/MutS family protein [Lentisphaeria bacterium]|nr:Smr/MutS family protein [Lentisphaeria bacterium]